MGREIATLGDTIRTARKVKKITAGELGKRLDPSVTHTTVCNWEKGVTEPSINYLKQICDILGLDVADFFVEECDRATDISFYYSRLNNTQRAAVLGVAKAMLE